MENNEPTIENRLKDLRKEHKLSQEELAEELGISRQSIIALEQGKYLPSLPLVVNLCKFFHSPFEEIFEFEREMEEIINHNENDPIKINIINNNLMPERGEANPTSSSPFLERAGLREAREDIMSNEMEQWRPVREMVSLRDAMDRLFEDSVITPRGTSAIPKIDIKDKKDSIEVKAELPGLKEEDVEVEISDGVMTISGEKSEEKEEKEEGYYYKESHSGSFSRSFTLPTEVMGEKAVAEMKKGVLIISIPKVEPKKATKVKISGKK